MHRPAGFMWPLVDGYQVGQVRDGEGRPMPIESIAVGPGGEYIALSGTDKKIRIWSTLRRTEVSKLGHPRRIQGMGFLDQLASIYALHDNIGILWEKRNAQKRWKRNPMDGADFGPQPVHAVALGRVAVANKAGSVKLYAFKKANGAWPEPQTLFNQPKVTAMKFAGNGQVLFGGTSDGLLWQSGTSSGTMRALHAFEQTITSIDVDEEGTRALVGLASGDAVLFSVAAGGVERVYASGARGAAAFGALFAAGGKAVVHGTAQGCALVWDTAKAQVVYGMNNSEGASLAYEGEDGKPGFIITGSKGGQLVWWAQPSSSSKRRTE
ncbi:WD40-repeat-containing domain protein [Schizophyllum fasciatum]